MRIQSVSGMMAKSGDRRGEIRRGSDLFSGVNSRRIFMGIFQAECFASDKTEKEVLQNAITEIERQC